MNDTPTSEFDARMAAVMKSFADGLPARIEALADSFSRVAVGGDDQLEALVSLQAVAHKLAGSAGTFGFPEISETAGSMEVICREAVDAYPAEINGHVDALRIALQPLINGAAADIVTDRYFPD
mgnify:CR=1 FL=1